MTGDALLPPVLERAIRVAASAHRNQRRKGSDLPYVAHPAAVAVILINAGFSNANLLAAAWLHDVVEDTDVTIEDIRDQFPAAVAAIVDAMSETKDDADGNRLSWSVRKAHHIERMQDADEDTLAVMLADKLHNLTSMSVDAAGQPNFWDRFNASRDELLAYYEAMVAIAAKRTRLNHLCRCCEVALAALRGEL